MRIFPNFLIKAKCSKCGHTRAFYYELQIRSADEASTIFYTCEKCRHQWQEN